MNQAIGLTSITGNRMKMVNGTMMTRGHPQDTKDGRRMRTVNGIIQAPHMKDIYKMRTVSGSRTPTTRVRLRPPLQTVKNKIPVVQAQQRTM